MRNKNLAVSLFPYSVVCALVLTVTACTTEADRRQANHDFDYTNAKLGSRLVTPAPLKAPDYVNDYQVPIEVRHGDVGSQVDVRPPEQAMPFVNGSRPDANRQLNQIWYSAQSLNQNIQGDVWRWTNDFIAQNQIPVVRRDETNHVLDVGPIAVKFEEAKPDDIPPAPAQYYRIEMFNNPELHQTALRVTWLKPGDGAESPDIYAQQRYSTMLLNRVSAYMDTHANSDQYLIAQGPITLHYAGDTGASQNIVSDSNFATTWHWLTGVLPKAGLMLEQQSQSQGLIVFNYRNPNEGSLWDTLAFWKPTTPEGQGLGIKSGKYRLQLAEQAKQTSITFLNDGNQPMSAADVQRLYQLLQGYTSTPVAMSSVPGSDSAVVAAQETRSDVTAAPSQTPATALPVPAVVTPASISLAEQDGRWVAQTQPEHLIPALTPALQPMGFAVQSVQGNQVVVHYTVPDEEWTDTVAFWKEMPKRYAGLGEGNYVLDISPVGANASAVALKSADGKPLSVDAAFYRDLARHLQH